MDWKHELVPIPVSEIDRARDFYTEKLGFVLDHDVAPNENFRVVQLIDTARHGGDCRAS